MPKRVNKYPGIKKHKNGGYLARASVKGIEYSKVLETQKAAVEWKARIERDLRRAPSEVCYRGSMWECVLETPAGARLFSSTNLDEVVQWRDSTLNSIATGVWVDPVAAATTLSEYVEQWRRTKLGISGKTWAGYNAIIRTHFSTLSDTKLAHISTRRVRAWVSDMERSGVGATTIRQSYRLLHQILECATSDELIARNPVSGIELPRINRKARRALTIEELRTLADACTGFETMIRFTGITGLRFGEVTALQVRDINPLKREVTVRRAWTTEVSGKRTLSTTKTRRERTITIPAALSQELEVLIAGRTPEDWVFKGQHGNAVNDGWFRKHVFNPAVKSTGLTGVTFHCLRHTAASQLIRLGAPVTTVANILGHASTQMTLDVYGHHYENGQSQYMERYEADFQAGTEQERNGNIIEFPNDGTATA